VSRRPEAIFRFKYDEAFMCSGVKREPGADFIPMRRSL
jgi:hypothetical protein